MFKTLTLKDLYIKVTIYHKGLWLGGIIIPQNKLVHVGLTYIYGIATNFHNKFVLH